MAWRLGNCCEFIQQCHTVRSLAVAAALLCLLMHSSHWAQFCFSRCTVEHIQHNPRTYVLFLVYCVCRCNCVWVLYARTTDDFVLCLLGFGMRSSALYWWREPLDWSPLGQDSTLRTNAQSSRHFPCIYIGWTLHWFEVNIWTRDNLILHLPDWIKNIVWTIPDWIAQLIELRMGKPNRPCYCPMSSDYKLTYNLSVVTDFARVGRPTCVNGEIKWDLTVGMYKYDWLFSSDRPNRERGQHFSARVCTQPSLTVWEITNRFMWSTIRGWSVVTCMLRLNTNIFPV